MMGRHLSNGSARTSHHQRVRHRVSFFREPHPSEQSAVADPRRREENLFSAAQISSHEHPVDVLFPGGGANSGGVGGVSRPQLRLNLATHATHRRRCDNTLGRSPHAEERVHAALGITRRDGGFHVAVGYESDASPGLSQFSDDTLVSRSVEDHTRDVSNRFIERTSYDVNIMRGGLVYVDTAAACRPGGNLGSHREFIHVKSGARVIQRAALRDGDDGDCAITTTSNQRRAVQRVDRDVGSWSDTRAHDLAVMKHRRSVFLSLADDDTARELGSTYAFAYTFLLYVFVKP